jgi:hypothetical protein
VSWCSSDLWIIDEFFLSLLARLEENHRCCIYGGHRFIQGGKAIGNGLDYTYSGSHILALSFYMASLGFSFVN